LHLRASAGVNADKTLIFADLFQKYLRQSAGNLRNLRSNFLPRE
jgi:hypothetical protein